MAILSLRKYGATRGVSGEAVRKAINDGRIKTAAKYKDGKLVGVDSEVADREWVRNTDSRYQTQIAPGSRLDGANQIPTVTEKDEREVAKGAVPEIAKSNAIRAAYAARREKLEYEREAGKLVNAEQLRAEYFAAGRQLRDGIMSVPDRISAQLAAITDPHEVHRLLHHELQQALQKVVDDAG